MNCLITSLNSLLKCCHNSRTDLQEVSEEELMPKNKKTTLTSSLEKSLNGLKVSPQSAFKPYKKITEIASSAIQKNP